MEITEFIEARMAEEPGGCGGQGEYRGCDDISWTHPKMVAALRAVVALHANQDDGCPACVTTVDLCVGDYELETWPCPHLRHIAAIWADHPDYREEWRP